MRRSALSAMLLAAPLALAGCTEPTAPTAVEVDPQLGFYSSPFVIGAFDDARSSVGHISGDGFGFATGYAFRDARTVVGTKFPSVTYQTTNQVTPAALQGVDVFVINPIRTALSDEEICYLETYVNNGGALLETRNPTGRVLLGTQSNGFHGTSYQRAIYPRKSILNTPSYINEYGLRNGAIGSFGQIGDGLPVLRPSITLSPSVLQFEPSANRSGRAVLVLDEEMWMTGVYSGERAGQIGYYYNRALLSNIMYFLDAAPGLASGTDFSGCVPDNTPPEISMDVVTTEIWPPNHKMHLALAGVGALDDQDPNPALTVTVGSNEAINGPGDGSTDADWAVVDNGDGTFDVLVRAERDGGGDGRSYAITITATDETGNVSQESVAVSVPHDKGKGGGR